MKNDTPDPGTATPNDRGELVPTATGGCAPVAAAGAGALPGRVVMVPVAGLPDAPLFPDLLRGLTDDEWARLRSSIEKSGIISPVILSDAGELIDGWHRLKAARVQGLAEVPAVVVGGLVTKEKRELALELNVARRQLTAEEVREAVKRQVVESPGHSNRRLAVSAAEALGRPVDDRMVRRVRDRLEADGTLPAVPKTLGRDNRERPARRGTAPLAATPAAPGRAAGGPACRTIATANDVGVVDDDDGRLFDDDPVDATDEVGPATRSEAAARPPLAAPAQVARPAGRPGALPTEAGGDVAAAVWGDFAAQADRAAEAAAALVRLVAAGRGRARTCDVARAINQFVGVGDELKTGVLRDLLFEP